MGWLRLVGCLKIQVSSQNTGLFCTALLQKRPIFLSILLIVAIPYALKCLKLGFVVVALQHTATHCDTLQHTATHCKRDSFIRDAGMYNESSQHTATHCNTLQHTATHCNTLRHATTCCNTLRHMNHSHVTQECRIVHHNTLQHTATHCKYCNTLQHTATRCNI